MKTRRDRQTFTPSAGRAAHPTRSVQARMLPALAVVTTLLSLSPTALATTLTTVPLYSWWNYRRGDMFTTTDPNWRGTHPFYDQREGYLFLGLDGRVLAPTQPQPPDTVPLYNWWSSTRADNFLTSDPAWAGRVGDTRVSGGVTYRLFRIEGYVFTRALAGTRELKSYWSSELGDNGATSHGWAISGGRYYRTEGHVISPLFDRSWSRPMPDSSQQYGYESRPISGSQPVLTIITEDSTGPITRTRAHFESLLWGPAEPNLRSWISSNSNGRFTVTNAGVIGPLRLDTDEGAADALRVAVERGLVDLRSYDRNGDGEVTPAELAVLWVNNTSFAWGQTALNSICPAGAGLCFDGRMSGVGQHTNLATMIHELTHLMAGTEDIYGAQGNSSRLSIMSSTTTGHPDLTTDSLRRLFLVNMDPWNRMAAGWVEPIVTTLDEPGGCMSILPQSSPYSASYERPLLIPASQNQFVLVESRDRDVGTSDRDLPESGTALWYYEGKSTADRRLRIVPGGPIGPGPNGRIDSTVVGGDDRLSSAPPMVSVGANRFIETTLRGDDVQGLDAALWTISAPTTSLAAGARGGSALWTSEDGSFRVDPSRGLGRPIHSLAPVEMRVDGSDVEWQPVRFGALVPRIMYAPSSVRRGDRVNVTGMMGVSATGRTVALLDAAAGRYYGLPVHEWTCGMVTFDVPQSIPPGSYQLIVYNQPTANQSSNAMRLDVL